LSVINVSEIRADVMAGDQDKMGSAALSVSGLRAKASECRRLAVIVDTPQSREAYIRLARSYELLAEDFAGSDSGPSIKINALPKC
jgi:hypothetical protein